MSVQQNNTTNEKNRVKETSRMHRIHIVFGEIRCKKVESREETPDRSKREGKGGLWRKQLETRKEDKIRGQMDGCCNTEWEVKEGGLLARRLWANVCVTEAIPRCRNALKHAQDKLWLFPWQRRSILGGIRGDSCVHSCQGLGRQRRDKQRWIQHFDTTNRAAVTQSHVSQKMCESSWNNSGWVCHPSCLQLIKPLLIPFSACLFGKTND